MNFLQLPFRPNSFRWTEPILPRGIPWQHLRLSKGQRCKEARSGERYQEDLKNSATKVFNREQTYCRIISSLSLVGFKHRLSEHLLGMFNMGGWTRFKIQFK